MPSKGLQYGWHRQNRLPGNVLPPDRSSCSLASAAPPVRFPNVYGIDMPSRNELIANGRTDEEIAREIGCDELIYQDLDALIEDVRSVNPEVTSFEASCFSGVYVTGDITQEYLDGVEASRRDGEKQKAAAENQLELDLDLEVVE